MYARIFYRGSIARMFLMFLAFALAGFVTCEWLLAATDVPDRKPRKITVATWNLEWFFDDVASDNHGEISKKMVAPTRNEWEWKKKAVAKVIAEIQPTILCLQEVENRDVLFQLRSELNDNHGLYYRYAFISGYDFGTEQDVAILYQSGLVEYSRREQTQEMYKSKDFYNLSKHMLAEFEWGSGVEKEKLLILNAHLRAGAERSDMRKRQCRLIHSWLSDEIKSGANVIATGDFNTEFDCGEEPGNDEVSIVRGLVTDDPSDDLLDAHELIDANQRVTHLSGRQYDRLFYSASLKENTRRKRDLVIQSAAVYPGLVIQGRKDTNHWESYYKIPQAERDLSDHYPVVVTFAFK